MALNEIQYCIDLFYSNNSKGPIYVVYKRVSSANNYIQVFSNTTITKYKAQVPGLPSSTSKWEIENDIRRNLSTVHFKFISESERKSRQTSTVHLKGPGRKGLQMSENSGTMPACR